MVVALVALAEPLVVVLVRWAATAVSASWMICFRAPGRGVWER